MLPTWMNLNVFNYVQKAFFVGTVGLQGGALKTVHVSKQECQDGERERVSICAYSLVLQIPSEVFRHPKPTPKPLAEGIRA